MRFSKGLVCLIQRCFAMVAMEEVQCLEGKNTDGLGVLLSPLPSMASSISFLDAPRSVQGATSERIPLDMGISHPALNL